LDLERPPDK